MKEEIKYLGIDPGNSACKYAYFCGGEIRYGYIPNVTGPAIHLDLLPTGRDENILAVQILSADEPKSRNPAFIGELARRQLQEQAGQDRSRNKVESESINLIVPAVLGLLDSGERFILGVGATLQDYSEQAPLLQKKLTRRHEVKFLYGSKSGQTSKPEVMKTYTYAQAAAGLFGLLRTDDGRLKRNDWLESTVLAIDFGHGQVNVAVMDRLQFIKQACFSIDYGFYRIVNEVQQFLNAKPYYVTASIVQLQEAVERGFYLKNNNRIDLGSVIEKACAQLSDMVYHQITSQVSKVLLDKVNCIIVQGGGGKMMAPFVGGKFNLRPEIAENSLFANARGLLLVAREKAENEHGTR